MNQGISLIIFQNQALRGINLEKINQWVLLYVPKTAFSHEWTFRTRQETFISSSTLTKEPVSLGMCSSNLSKYFFVKTLGLILQVLILCHQLILITMRQEVIFEYRTHLERGEL